MVFNFGNNVNWGINPQQSSWQHGQNGQLMSFMQQGSIFGGMPQQNQYNNGGGKLNMFAAFAGALEQTLSNFDRMLGASNQTQQRYPTGNQNSSYGNYNSNPIMDISNLGSNPSSEPTIFQSTGDRAKDFDEFTMSDMNKPNDAFDFTKLGYKSGDGVEAYSKEALNFAEERIAQNDSDKDGKLSIDEFMQGQNAAAPNLSEQLKDSNKKAFQNADLNGDGFIDKQEDAAIIAYMDNDNGKVDGKIKRGDTTVPLDNSKIKSTIQSSFDFLFGKK